MKERYGILDEDTYNFDKRGFMMGVIGTSMVITAIERESWPKAVQPGNRKWVTVIQGVGAKGWAIPPFIILDGQCHLSSWYTNAIPHDWVLAVSDNGWTTNKFGIQCVKHFNAHAKARTVGTYWLLILNGHGRHH
jgi:hypothetical protein